MTVGELRRMLELFSDDKKVVLSHMQKIIGIPEDYHTEVASMQVISMYGKDTCIIELEDTSEFGKKTDFTR